MWCDYNKTFVFRDCFDKEQTEGNIRAIKGLLGKKQVDGSVGVLIGTELMFSAIATRFNAFQHEDTREWILEFSNVNTEVASMMMDKYKEVHVEFTIEERLEDGEISIHCCLIKGFKEYQ